MRKSTFWRLVTTAILTTSVLGVVFHAHGDVIPGSLVPLTQSAASQPASAPAAAVATVAQVAKNTTSINWMQWAMVALAVSTFLSTLATSLTKRVPQATNVAQWLLVVADVLSFWGHKDSPTSFNLPGRRSDPPVDAPKV